MPCPEPVLTAAGDFDGHESSLLNLLAHMAELECWAGKWPVAERYAAGSWNVAEQAGQRAWRWVPLYVRALVDAHLGRLDAARAEAGEGLSVATAAHDS
jgi:hypothetical protein